jgi:hypothetical protein
MTGFRDPSRDWGLVVFLVALFAAFVVAVVKCVTES